MGIKKIALLLPVLVAGCASPDNQYRSVGQTPPLPPMYTGRLPEPNSALEVDLYVRPLSRNEVITAIQECEGNGARAVMVYGKRKVSNYTSDVVIDVTCAPKFRPLF